MRRGGVKRTGVGFAMIMLATVCANAADHPIPCCAPPPPPLYPPPPMPPPLPIYPWLGPYVGANAGLHWTSDIGGPSPSGFTGGIQGGFNWQFGPWVYGIETDFNLSSASDRFADTQFSNPFFGTVRGRAGYTINNFLVYGTGGLAYGVRTIERGGLSDSSLHGGWTVGIGVEVGLAAYGFGPGWSVKAEYLHIDLSQGVVLPASVPINSASNVLRFGFNYHF